MKDSKNKMKIEGEQKESKKRKPEKKERRTVEANNFPVVKQGKQQKERYFGREKVLSNQTCSGVSKHSLTASHCSTSVKGKFI